ncbi:hypothetical protein JCM3770_002667 [Rhodotorula araucariae]
MTAAPTPPLLRLSPELLDNILVLAVPSKPRPARLALSRLLGVCRTLAPLVRRHLYAKLSLVVAVPSRQDQKLMCLLRDGTAGPLVRFLKVRAPEPEPILGLDPAEDPVAALVPRPRMPQPETIAWVAEALERMPVVRYLDLQLRVAAWLEGDMDPAGDFGSTTAAAAAIDRLRRALVAWAATLETALVALEDAQQRLQVWAHPRLGRAPHVDGLAAWDRLTTLDLWRVQIVLSARADAGDDELPPPPRFRLRTLILTQCELGGAAELRWLLGAAGSARSAALTELHLCEVEFAHHPESSAPLLAVLPDPSAPGYTAPAFASTLTGLELLLSHPVGRPTPAALLAPLTALRTVTLGGPGIDPALVASLFTGAPATAPAPAPSHSIAALTLQYLAHVPLAALLGHLEPRAIPALGKLALHEAWTHPRRMTWRERRETPEPVWRALEDDGAWTEVDKTLRGVWRARRREGVRGAEVRLWRNKLEREYLAEGDSSDGDGDGDGTHRDDDAEGDSSDDDGARSSPDPNALWVPPASDDDGDEAERDWLARRRREAEEDDEAWESDF